MVDLKDLLNIENVDSQLEKIKQNLLSDKRLIRYLNQHNIQLTEERLNNSLMNLLTFNDYYFRCEDSTSYEECTQELMGYRPEIVPNGNRLDLVYRPCPHKMEHDRMHQISSNVRAFYLPKNILKANIESIELSKDSQSTRNQAINRIFSFASTYDGTHYQKGIYLYGPFGVGKTYLLAAMANELAKKNIQVGLVYLPDLIRELKGAIGNRNLETVLDEVKNMNVLILDDIGSEMVTAWVRDEIIGPLLQYRMLEELPTFFTSNKSISELIHDYSRTTDGSIDKSKANRIGDRIKALTTQQFIDGKNYRY